MEALHEAALGVEATAAPAPASETQALTASENDADQPSEHLTVTVLRGKRSRRTPLAAFHGLLAVRAPRRVGHPPNAI